MWTVTRKSSSRPSLLCCCYSSSTSNSTIFIRLHTLSLPHPHTHTTILLSYKHTTLPSFSALTLFCYFSILPPSIHLPQYYLHILYFIIQSIRPLLSPFHTLLYPPLVDLYPTHSPHNLHQPKRFTIGALFISVKTETLERFKICFFKIILPRFMCLIS